MAKQQEKRAESPDSRELQEERGDREAEPRMRQRLEAFIPDLVRRTVTAGLGAVLNSEDSIRKMAQEFSLPKDVAQYLIQTASSTKDEVFKVFAREIREFLQGLNLSQELAKVLTQLSFEIKTEIRFIPNDEAVSGIKPNIKRKVAIKRQRKGKGGREDETLEEVVGEE